MSAVNSLKTDCFDGLDDCVDTVIERLDKRVVLGLPLGLGKANHVVNAFFTRAQADPSISLQIITALTLEPPAPSGALSRRFLEPLLQRQYAHYPELAYARARRRNELPSNVEVFEFYLKPGAFLGRVDAQQDYLSSNYTHAARDLLDRGVNVIAQMIAPHPYDVRRCSLSCNPDITLDLVNLLGQRRDEIILIGQINRLLPFMPNDAEVDMGFFDYVVQAGDFTLFPVPLMPLAYAEYAIALHVVSLIEDGGTLQIGIGSLGDAIAYVLCLRHRQNGIYRRLLRELIDEDLVSLRKRMPPAQQTFNQGLYGASEMFVEGMLHLYHAGVLRRRVYADATLQMLLNQGVISEAVNPQMLRALLEHGCIHSPLTAADVNFLQKFEIINAGVRWHNGVLQCSSGERLSARLNEPGAFESFCRHALGTRLGGGIYMHAGFYLGSAAFYEHLRRLDHAVRAGINMTGVSFINALYGQEHLKRMQRRQARFINSAMMVTLTGAVVSDTLDNGEVVSGVGGQYNFVAQAHELAGARSIICLPSTRLHHGRLHSNIVWQYPQQTIPRHLRDIVVTEYGAADLRGKSDRDVIASMLAICDSRFQSELLKAAKQAGKIEQDYVIPPAFQHNNAERLRALFVKPSYLRWMPYYPLGTCFTAEEAALAVAFKYLKTYAGAQHRLIAILLHGWWCRRRAQQAYLPLLRRLRLAHPKNIKDCLYHLIIIGALTRSLDLDRPLTLETKDIPV